MRGRSAAELASLMEKAGLPFAPIRRPEDLYDDEHLLATGGLADVRLPDGPKAGETVKTTLLPFTLAARASACGSTRRARRPQPGAAALVGFGRRRDRSAEGEGGGGLRRSTQSGDKLSTSPSPSPPPAAAAGTPSPPGACPCRAGPVRHGQVHPAQRHRLRRRRDHPRGAPALAKALKASVVVDNQPGAGGVVGLQALARSAPDGSTLSVVSNNVVIFPSVLKSLPFDMPGDFTPIAVVGATPDGAGGEPRQGAARTARTSSRCSRASRAS
jgi:hypothetical protein